MAYIYTDNDLDTIVGTYSASVEQGDDYAARDKVMQTLAAQFKSTVPSIRGKLNAEGVYVKKEVASTATGKTGASKEEMTKAVEAMTGLKLPSMSNMTKKDLDKFLARFIEMSDIRNAEEGK